MYSRMFANPASIYEFKRDVFDESNKVLKKKVENTKNLSNDEMFDVLVSIKDLEKEMRIHQQEITVCTTPAFSRLLL